VSFWWLATANSNKNPRAVNNNGNINWNHPNKRNGVVRPDLLFERTKAREGYRQVVKSCVQKQRDLSLNHCVYWRWLNFGAYAM